MFNQQKCLLIRFCRNTSELDLVNNALDAIYSVGGGTAFAADATSQVWSIENPEVKCDVCTLDSAVDSSIASHLLEGKNLNIHYSTYIAQEQVVAGIPFSVNVNRSLSRLKTMFITFVRTVDAGSGPSAYLKRPTCSTTLWVRLTTTHSS